MGTLKEINPNLHVRLKYIDSHIRSLRKQLNLNKEARRDLENAISCQKVLIKYSHSSLTNVSREHKALNHLRYALQEMMVSRRVLVCKLRRAGELKQELLKTIWLNS